MGILPPAHDETWVSEKRDGKIKIVINQWLKFGAHDDTNMTLHHTFYCPRNAKNMDVCGGVTTYKGPSQYMRAEKDATFAYSTLKYLNRYHAQLNHKLRSHLYQ